MRSKETSSASETDASSQKYLSHEECCDLVYKAKDGDKTAESRIIETNLGLVSSIARRYAGCGLELDEIIQAGNLGVMRASLAIAIISLSLAIRVYFPSLFISRTSSINNLS